MVAGLLTNSVTMDTRMHASRVTAHGGRLLRDSICCPIHVERPEVCRETRRCSEERVALLASRRSGMVGAGQDHQEPSNLPPYFQAGWIHRHSCFWFFFFLMIKSLHGPANSFFFFLLIAHLVLEPPGQSLSQGTESLHLLWSSALWRLGGDWRPRGWWAAQLPACHSFSSLRQCHAARSLNSTLCTGCQV